MRRFIRITIGISLLMLGLAGLVLPVLQGWLFLGTGALVLSRDVPLFARIVNWVSYRFPRAGRAMRRVVKIIPAAAD